MHGYTEILLKYLVEYIFAEALGSARLKGAFITVLAASGRSYLMY